jgi:hypothetical protein
MKPVSVDPILLGLDCQIQAKMGIPLGAAKGKCGNPLGADSGSTEYIQIRLDYNTKVDLRTTAWLFLATLHQTLICHEHLRLRAVQVLTRVLTNFSSYSWQFVEFVAEIDHVLA